MSTETLFGPSETSSLNSRFWNTVLPSRAMLDHSLALCHPTGSGLVGRSRKNEDLSLLKPNERVETAPPSERKPLGRVRTAPASRTPGQGGEENRGQKIPRETTLPPQGRTQLQPSGSVVTHRAKQCLNEPDFHTD